MAIIEPEFLPRAADERHARLLAADIPFGPVLTMSGYLSHPQVEWLEVVEPERYGVSLMRPPWRFDGARPGRPGSTPWVGEHSREIAAEVYAPARIDELVANGVLFADQDVDAGVREVIPG